LKKSCRDASYFYFAVHTLRDPAVPYLVLIPLAADSLDTGPDAEYLDILDIRNCDLSRCRVAILSGCSSGAPYVALAGSGPSLGDAFLDSGSGAVIQTFWDVDDNDARNLMTAFVRLWKGTCLTEVKTLSEARRRAMMSSDGVRHPSSWASYSIKLSKL
jgi:CHAT domain-containing protein